MALDTINTREQVAEPAKPDPKEPWKPGNPITVKLSVPLRTASHDRTELTLQMPTARMLRKYGEIVRTINLTPKDQRIKDQAREVRQEVAFDYDAVVGLLADSTGLSMIELDGLAANDLNYLANTLNAMVNLRGPLV